MRLKPVSMLASMLLLGGSLARADYHSILIGVQLNLSTTTIGRGVGEANMTAAGITQILPGGSSFRMPSQTIDGYLWTLSSDPALRNLAGEQSIPANALSKSGLFSFLLRNEVVRLKFPRVALARTQTPRGLYISTGSVLTAKRVSLPFDGDAGMGEPIFVLPWQAELLSTQAPHFSCDVQGEGQNGAWVSYNPAIGDNELAPLCEEGADLSLAVPLVKKGKVFHIAYPYD